VLGVVGFLVNLVGALWDFAPQRDALLALGIPLYAPESYFDPRYAQIPGMLALGLHDQGLIDLPWMVRGVPSMRLALLLLGCAGVGVLSGAWVWRRQRGVALLAGGALLLCGGLWFVLGELHRQQSPLVREALAALPGSLPEGSALWYDEPRLAEAVLNQVKRPLAITGFNVSSPGMTPIQAERAGSLARTATAPIFVLSNGPDRYHHALDLLLLDHLHFVGETHVESLRLNEYWQGPLSEPVPYDLLLEFPEGAIIQLMDLQVTPRVAQGQVLALSARWQAASPLPDDIQVFVHLRDADGIQVLQRDGPPAQGLHPPSTWLPGEPVTDRHALRLPADLPPGDYTLHLGLYRLEDLARATAQDGQSEIVIPVRVE
jgi:hypothetical protein